MQLLTFRQQVQAEAFPERLSWQGRDTFTLTLLPLIFLLPLLINALFTPTDAVLAYSDLSLRAMLFLALCCLYRDMLAHHWRRFQAGGWRSWALVVGAAIGLQLCISGVKLLLPTMPITDTAAAANVFSPAMATLLLLSLGPIVTALIEDIVFRYALLQKLFLPNRLWRLLLVLANSALFGLVHYHNFGGHLIATVSFMAAGLFLNLVYLWTRNIWHVLLCHTLNNAVLSLGGVVLILLLQAFGVPVEM